VAAGALFMCHCAIFASALNYKKHPGADNGRKLHAAGRAGRGLRASLAIKDGEVTREIWSPRGGLGAQPQPLFSGKGLAAAFCELRRRKIREKCLETRSG
jgi:hypothetical protein